MPSQTRFSRRSGCESPRRARRTISLYLSLGCGQFWSRRPTSPARGTQEDSPALQRWVGVVNEPSPVGTAQLSEKLLFQIPPIHPHVHFYLQRYLERVDIFHALRDQPPHRIHFVFWRFEDELVVHLQQHSRS